MSPLSSRTLTLQNPRPRLPRDSIQLLLSNPISARRSVTPSPALSGIGRYRRKRCQPLLCFSADNGSHHCQPRSRGSMPTLATSQGPQTQSTMESGNGKARGGYTRQRRGCLTCRQRKKKCDQVFPICGHCSRLNFACKRETPRRFQSSPESYRESDQGDGSTSTSPWGSGHHDRVKDHHVSEILRLAKASEPLDLVCFNNFNGNYNLSASRRAMMRYYTATLAVMLSTNVENNCFLSVLLPMAFDCPTLLEALAACSSAHLALRYPEFYDTSLQHRGLALSRFNASLKDGNLSGDMCVAVALVMCSMETISVATSGSWAHHLAGAAAALQSNEYQMTSLGDHLDGSWPMLRSFEGKWLLRNFAYHDILMSVSLNRRPLLIGDYWMSSENALADPYFAFASRIMLLISEISVLNADCADHRLSHGGDDSAFMDVLEHCACKSLMQRGHDISTSLQEWECPSAISADSSLALLSETYRSAAQIYLHRVLRKYFPASSSSIFPEGVRIQVKLICNMAQKVPEGCLAECSLLFPLFIAGGEAEDPCSMEVIRNRLFTMNRWRKFRNVDACRDVLDEVWRRRAEGTHAKDAERVDWLDIVKHRNWQLALS